MIQEDYVSFETAKLLKEKGFDAYGDGSYDSGIEIYKEYSPVGKLNSCATSKPSKKAYPAPTLQMAMKWLREVHKMYMYVAHDSMENTWFARVYNDYKTLFDVDNHSTFEEACEVAIKYCLENLI